MCIAPGQDGLRNDDVRFAKTAFQGFVFWGRLNGEIEIIGIQALSVCWTPDEITICFIRFMSLSAVAKASQIEVMTMKRFLLIAVLAMPASDALAISRYDTAGMSCAVVQSHLAQEGAAILRYPSRSGGPTLYDRYVRDASGCGGYEQAVQTSVPTRDGSCAVKVCRGFTGRNNH